MFIDYVEISVKAGNGGDGAVTFRREKYVPKGGPSGGNGGNGGSVYIQAASNLSTLLDLKYKKNYSAKSGQHGGNSLKDGKTGDDIIIRVPCGTLVHDLDADKTIDDLNEDGKQILVAKGGRGGKGNSNFATATNQTPRFAESGRSGEEKNLALELKLIADVGLVGFPNAGKSTLISTISAARPKIADYPFTTLEPNLGIVRYKNYQSFTVADIPGIIEGASQGKGLGLKFLKHIERTKVLLFLIDATSEDPKKDFEILNNELKEYSSILAKKSRLVSFSKADLLEQKEIEKLAKLKFKGVGEKPIVFSAVQNFNIDALLDEMWNLIQAEK